LTSCANINFSGRTLLHGVSWERIFTLWQFAVEIYTFMKKM
jgi:hypothetical protein